MKGIILAGGKATRLRPLTLVTNKHLLPIYHKPMIFYPLEAMQKTGIKDVLIITNPDHIGHFISLFHGGQEFGLKLSYEIQNEAGGLSHAVRIAEGFVGQDKSMVILGDNIFTHNLASAVEKFEKKDQGAMIFAKEMEDANQYGVVELDANGRVISIEEKPKYPKTNLAQTGIYMYDNTVFEKIKNLQPSERGELEITDLNNLYARAGTLDCEIMDGWWIDAGTSFDELLRANQQIAQLVRDQQAP